MNNIDYWGIAFGIYLFLALSTFLYTLVAIMQKVKLCNFLDDSHGYFSTNNNSIYLR